MKTDPYIHGHHESVLRSHRWRTVKNSAQYLLPHLSPGMSLLDVGCGPGTLTADIAAAVAPGPVVGLDIHDGVLSSAREYVATRQLDNVSFINADLMTAELGTHDVVHAHQVLQHLRHPSEALRRLSLFVRPGGILACRDADYSDFWWTPNDRRLDRWLEIYLDLGAHLEVYPDAGARLAAWTAEAGLSGTYTQSEWAFIAASDRRWWSELWAERTTRSEFADNAISSGLTSRQELDQLASAWREWGLRPGGKFIVPHGEILINVA